MPRGIQARIRPYRRLMNAADEQNTTNAEQISILEERGDPLRLQTFLYSKQLQIIFIIYRRPCDTVRVKKQTKIGAHSFASIHESRRECHIVPLPCFLCSCEQTGDGKIQ